MAAGMLVEFEAPSPEAAAPLRAAGTPERIDVAVAPNRARPRLTTMYAEEAPRGTTATAPSPDIWSNTDFPYMCLRDRVRTEALRAEIESVVLPGDTVLDVGAGTGILSLLALRAGAAHVWAVEADPTLSHYLRQTFEANGYGDRATVVRGDAREVDVPAADVVVAELIETGLMSELQVPVMNALHRRGVVGRATRFIPDGYRTSLELVHTDRTFYGFEIRGERHEWSFYGDTDVWSPVTVQPLSAPVRVWEGRFDTVLAEDVAVRVTFPVRRGGLVNAVRVSGQVLLAHNPPIGACPSMNGDKVVDIPVRRVQRGYVVVDVRYTMGAGLDSLEVDWVS
jgi:predicted RNA methylase